MMQSRDSAPRVSVLIATLDRPDHLADCLPTVLANDYLDFEVIVVDQSEGDASRRVVEALADPRARYLHQRPAGLSRARNAAVAAARGELLAFTDDDCRVSAGWLRRIVEVFDRDAGAGMIFGAFVPISHDPAEAFVPGFEPARYRRLEGRRATRLNRSEAGGNMAIRRAVLDAAGPFDHCFGPGAEFAGGDDSDMNDRVLRAGWAVVHDPSNPVTHLGLRRYDDGSARRLLLDGSSARGALIAKDLRCGNLVAAYRISALVTADGARVAWELARRRRRSGAGRLRASLHGFARGLVHPLDRRRGLFLDH
jgi:glycosyltransferase involved in cell wall biosynthesis